jgi:uncharacterized protein YkwD
VELLGKRLPTALTAAFCAGLLALAPAAAAASTATHKIKHTTRARVACAAQTARTHVRAHAALHDCRVVTHKTRAAAHRTKRPTPAAPAASAATAAQEAAAKISAALATPCQNTELTPEPANLALVREATLCLVNQERAQNGRVPLTANPELDQAAENHTEELIADDYFAHISPTGETPVNRIQDTGYIPGPSVGYVIGENLAWGTLSLATPRAIVSAWIASPEHLANILEAQYTETGIGVTAAVPSFLVEGDPAGATYAQEFGVIIR